jgi:tetratricopeptide (TPR) repeat protein
MGAPDGSRPPRGVALGIADSSLPESYVLSLLAEGRHQAALDVIPEFGAPETYAPHFVSLASRLWRAGRPEEAAEVLEKTLQLAPDLSSAWLSLGMLRLQQDRLQEGDRCLAEAAARDRAAAPAHYLRGIVANTSNRDADAVGHFTRCLEVDPAHRDAAAELRALLDEVPDDHPLRDRAVRALAVARQHARAAPERATLTACLITRNEIDSLPRCLKSIRPVADQIIVVDTGSTDGTREAARRLGAEVHDLPWSDDFAAARNAAIERAACDWVLIMDADEQLPPGSAAQLRELLARPPQAAVCQLLTYAPSSTPARAGLDLVGHLRLFRRGLGIHFQGAIHEQLVDREGRLIDSAVATGIVVHHHGYLESREAVAERGERNLRLLSARAEAEPDNAYVLFHLGHAQLASGEAEAGVSALRRALDLADDSQPFRPKTAVLLAQALQFFGRHAQAEEAIRAVLASHPEDPELLCALGRILEALDRADDAIEVYRAATRGRFGPNTDYHDFPCRDVVPRGRLAALHLSRGQADAAMEEIGAGLAVRPEATDLRHMKASALIALSESQRARAELGALLTDDPGDAVAHNLLGVTYALEKEHKRAIREFEVALALHPQDLDALCNLATAYHSLGDYDRARDCFEAALTHCPTHVPAWLGLARAYLESRAYESSALSYEMAAKHSGCAPEVMSEIAAARAELAALAEQAQRGGDD